MLALFGDPAERDSRLAELREQADEHADAFDAHVQFHDRLDREQSAVEEALPAELREQLESLLGAPEQERLGSVTALVRQHPEHYAAVRRIWRDLAITDRPAQSDEALPPRIGSYQIVSLLGEGGMGSVYLAEQTEPVRRRVALKLIKLGMDSQAVVSRFAQERQALALMEHEGIAKVFDCGTSDRGQPYFVMELVEGLPLDSYCDRQRLSLPDRLQLMRQVCAAVQHAHQKGVVHRDLKPGNVLVSTVDGLPRVKIIDFGLAKALGDKLVEATLFTGVDQVVGTPEFMAPEQAACSQSHVDTRADVYSLGVMLYETLIGQLPFAGADLRRAGLLEMQRVLREVEPQRPSTRLSASIEGSAAIAHARRLSLPALQKALRTDLDWIVLKALEKDPDHRYDSTNALAEDLRRYLEHEPVMAGPPSASYRLRKLLRRHRLPFSVAGGLFLVLLAGAASTFVQWRRAETQSEQNQQLVESERAVRRTYDLLSLIVYLERAQELLADMFPSADPAAARARLTEAIEPLQRGLPEIRRQIELLGSKAGPRTDDERRRDLESSPSYAAYRQQQQLLTEFAAARESFHRDRGELLARLPFDAATASESQLKRFAISLTRPGTSPSTDDLCLAMAAVETLVDRLVEGDELEKPMLVLALLAGIYGSLGLYGEGCASLTLMRSDPEKEVQLATAARISPEHVQELRRAFAWQAECAAARLAELEGELRRLEQEVQRRRTWNLRRVEDEFLLRRLTELEPAIAGFLAKEVSQAMAHLYWEERVVQLTIVDHADRWRAASLALRRPDGEAASTLYGDGFDLRPQRGLVPIGKNPVTGLWEFYHLASAVDRTTEVDPASLPIPTHDEQGRIEVTGATGIVFVLVPGGTAWCGSQKTDAQAPMFDPNCDTRSEWPPLSVALDPFFLARHELSYGQWLRLSGQSAVPSELQYGTDPVWGYDWRRREKVPFDVLRGPDVGKSAAAYATLLRGWGLALPTSAQWEYACRAGTETIWFCGNDEAQLVRFANLYDLRRTCRSLNNGNQLECAMYDDGFHITSPVGFFEPNGWGFHDVYGNVAEWCGDGFGFNSAGALGAGDGRRLVTYGMNEDWRDVRGGSYEDPPRLARSAAHKGQEIGFVGELIGARACRAIQR